MRCLAMFLLALGTTVSGRADGPPPADPITEISLERTLCFGSCPADKVVLRSDGTATYTGKNYVERIGTYEGRMRQEDYAKLAELMEARKFFEMQGRYLAAVTDHPSVITSATRGGKTKVVDNYADSGPIELWGIEKTIQGVVAGIKWKRDE